MKKIITLLLCFAFGAVLASTCSMNIISQYWKGSLNDGTQIQQAIFVSNELFIHYTDPNSKEAKTATFTISCQDHPNIVNLTEVDGNVVGRLTLSDDRKQLNVLFFHSYQIGEVSGTWQWA